MHQVTVIVRGRLEKNQLLCVSEKELGEDSIVSLRNLVASQDLDVPAEYSILTTSGLILSSKQESMLTLRDITSQPPSVNVDTLVTDEGNHLDLGLNLKLLIQDSADTSSVPDAAAETPSDQPCNCQTVNFVCPFRAFKDVFNIHDHMNMKTLLKVILGMTFFLFSMILIMITAIQMLSMTWGSLGLNLPVLGHSSVNSIDVEDMMSLKLKVHEVELSAKYKLETLEKRMVELEDVYLKDHQVQLHNIAELKAGLVKLTSHDWITEPKSKGDRSGHGDNESQ